MGVHIGMLVEMCIQKWREIIITDESSFHWSSPRKGSHTDWKTWKMSMFQSGKSQGILHGVLGEVGVLFLLL